jgi:rod shape-determining protein MreC
MSTRANVIAIAGFIIALVALLIFAANPRKVRRMQDGFLGMITPLLKTGGKWQRTAAQFREGLKTLEQLETENEALRVSNKELKATNQTLRGLEADNLRLRAALQYHERAKFQTMPAQIIGRDASTWYNSIVIDRGKEDLIEPDLPVITEEGLVGKTTVVSPHSSIVILISDETCKVAANVENSREQGIVHGERTSSGAIPEVTMNFLSKQANLQPGQKVFTSGVGGVFPAGVLIGSVREFTPRELDGVAEISPAVDLTTLQDVFVVLGDTK